MKRLSDHPMSPGILSTSYIYIYIYVCIYIYTCVYVVLPTFHFNMIQLMKDVWAIIVMALQPELSYRNQPGVVIKDT